MALLWGALLWPSPGRAQVPPELRGRRIVDVRLEGDAGAVTADVAGLEVGQRLSRRALRRALQRLLSTERWADVQVDAVRSAAGVALVIRVRPRIVLSRIEVRGARVLSALDIKRTLGLGADAEIEEGALPDLARTVAALYAERGYVDARVTVRLLDTDDPSRKVLVVGVEEGEPLRVEELTVEGDELPAQSGARSALGLGPGAPLDQGRLREGLRRAEEALRAEGYLEARLAEPRLERDEDGARVVLPVRLGPRYRVILRGYEPLERGALEGALELRLERLTRAVLSALEDKAVDLFRRYGFHHAEVTVSRHRGPEDGTVDLLVDCRPGAQLRVESISFPGATHFAPGYLQDQFLSVVEEALPSDRFFAPVDSDTVDRLLLSGDETRRTRSVPAPLEADPASVYYAPAYQAALEHLQEVYQAAGFLDVEVGPARLDELDARHGRVVIPVLEGPRTMLFEVRTEGATRLTDRDLLEVARLRRGDPFSYLALEEAIERVVDAYQERGYLYARVDPTVRFSGDRQRAAILLTVTERFPVRVDGILIDGAERTDEGLIRDAMHLQEGDLVRPSAMEASRRELLALGVFTSASITPVDPEVPEPRKALVVRVHERLPQVVDFSAGISTGQGVRAAFEYGYRNLFGYAVTVSLRAQVGFQFFFTDAVLERNITALPLVDRLERRITGSVTIPRFSTVDNLRAALDLVHVRDNERAFGLDKNGVILSWLFAPIQRTFRLILSAELEQNNVELLGDIQDFDEFREMQTDPRVIRLLRVPEGNSVVVSTRLQSILDLRDSPFVPTTGIYLSGTVEWAYTLSTEAVDENGDPFFSNFLKFGATANGYIPLGDVVLAGQVRGGYIQHLADNSVTYPNRQYFLGGVDTLRGFFQDQVQPQDVAFLGLQPSIVTLGGDMFMLFRGEVRIPLVASVQAGLFADVGNHWRDPSTIGVTFALRPTAGLGLRIATPVGPLALDYGFNLDRRTELNEPFGAFHFSIGVF